VETKVAAAVYKFTQRAVFENAAGACPLLADSVEKRGGLRGMMSLDSVLMSSRN
jgi:hypothetical protein